MKKLTGNQIRTMWLDFFKSKGHTIIPGASLIPHNDPTLLWINSGVAAIKRLFDGTEIPLYRRLTNVQKSIRTNDIENVGYTARHHTFFEMLGNFSIGDYFRKDAISWAFEILTSKKYFDIPVELLYITYSPNDFETLNMWIKEGIPSDHMVPIESNFWQIGSGPCGPNTEMFFDRGVKYDQKNLGIELLKQEIENDRYIEIWNIVFSQFNGVEGVARDKYQELPSKNIDTGAGLERIACVLQQTDTNFETDLFFPVIEETIKLASIGYKESGYRPYRVIADHIRTISFALSDGASFSNEGRGYVLRRILRRALRYGRKIGINEPFMYRLVPVVASMMEDFYPYLKPEVDKVTRMVKFEEEKFIRTLITGENLLRKMIGEQKKVTGEDAFKLFDTYGFPIELSQEIALEQNITVDISRFEQLMEEQRVRARSSRSDAQSMHNQSKDLLEFTTPSIFNYNPAIIKAKVIGLFVNGVKVKELTEEGDVVLDTTTFYAESGGQVADQGQLVNETTLLEVRDVKKGPNQQHFHHVSVSYGQVHVGDVLETRIDQVKRQLTAKNHSSLHLLQSSLIQVLGKDVHQQGSFVSHEYGRFDFSYHTKVSETELQQIESIVNRYIEESSPGTIKLMPIEKAKKSGAISPFDEKYGDVVRVVSFGSVSKEFCGGTHVSNTSDIGVFVIVLEESIAAGTRRIVSLTGFKAYEQLKQREKMLAGVRDTLGASSIFEIGDRLKAQISEKVIFQTQISKLMEKQAILSSQSLLVKFKVHNGLEILSSYLPDTSSDSLLKIVDALKSKKPDSIILLIGSSNGSFPIVAFTGLSAQNKGIKANNVVKQVALLLAGSGGGRNDLAFGAGKNLDKIETALKVLEN